MIIFTATFIASAIFTGILVKYLPSLRVIANPSERSNHSTPTPTGGGIAFVSLASIAIASINESQLIQFLAPMLILMMVGFLDDIFSLPVLLRLITQALSVSYGLFVIQAELSQELSFLAMIALLFAWVWFINLYNFMDGINGIAAAQAIAISLGILAIFSELHFEMLFLIAALSGFLIFNWGKAKIFMGDSGSLSLGYILGGVLIYMAFQGLLYEAIILPAYFILDASITLTKRIYNKEKIWQAHSSHFYQRAVRAGLSHARVVSEISINNLTLIILAILSHNYNDYSFIFVIAGYAITSLLLYRFARLEAS